MRNALLTVLLLACACLPRDNPFDRPDIQSAYQVRVSAPDGVLMVEFNRFSGMGVRGYRVYRENERGDRVLVAELDHKTTSLVDEAAADAALEAQELTGSSHLWWRVAAFTDGGEGPLSARIDAASTHALPETTIDPPLPEYITGQAGVAVLVQVASSPVHPDVTTRLFRYRFRGGEWTDPILAGPLVLTGLLDGRYTLEAAAVDDNGNVDLTPATSAFSYDFNVPEGTSCDPAVCSAGLRCVTEPVGKFCRRICGGDTGVGCAEGLECRLASGEGGTGACVATAQAAESCADRLCTDGLACGSLPDARALCGTPCSNGCAMDEVCRGDAEPACMREARLNESCADAACEAGLACDDRDGNPRCARICQQTLECAGAQICGNLGRGELKVCR